MPAPASLVNFDIMAADVTVWAFKKSGGAAGSAPTFTGRWVESDDALNEELRRSVAAARTRIDEVHPYGLLAQNNEASALHITTTETHGALIVMAASDPLPQRRITALKQLQNIDFYVIKLTSGGRTLHAVRKTDASWRTTRRRALIDVLLDDQTLILEERPAFSLSKAVDFIILDNDIYILDKLSFESILSYKEAHAQDFRDLQAEVAFSSLFTDLAPLAAFVGTNKIQLRRACAIRAKGHYRDANFMQRLRMHHAQYHLTLQFNPAGLLEPTPETCGDIITALLDHRLSSAFSQSIYDVPDAVKVQ